VSPFNPALTRLNLEKKMASTGYYDRFLHLGVTADCPGCGRTLRLGDFRGAHSRRLRPICVRCAPEKGLEDMTPDERLAALDNQRPYVTPTRVARLNAADAAAETHRRKAGALQRRRAQRTRNWAPVLRALQAEHTWAQGHAQFPGSAAWGEFFAAYAAALSDAIRRVRAASSGTSRLVPLPEQTDPMHWLYDETVRSLRKLYAACAPIPGRRLYRDPMFLQKGK
jgi:hypothetical protein